MTPSITRSRSATSALTRPPASLRRLAAHYALQLTSATPVTIGDIPPGEERSVTFSATATSGDAWAVLAVEVMNSAGTTPIERLWAHHPVDSTPPQFFGMTQPAYVVALGETVAAGYAYDEAGISSVRLAVGRRSRRELLAHWPDAGQWSCPWTITGSHDQVLQVALQAEDTLGQASEWSAALPFVVDALPPVVSIDTATTGIASGGVTRGALRLYGDVSDTRGLGRVEVCDRRRSADKLRKRGTATRHSPGRRHRRRRAGGSHRDHRLLRHPHLHRR